MLNTIKNFPVLIALNFLALINAFVGGAFDSVFESIDRTGV